jgi:glutamyl-tRNA synthetase
MLRVRFAPSPTGYLHVGGARTALFNWLLARRHGGIFVLRIEDTDADRSSGEMVDGILDGMRWLGLDWDEGPLVGGPHAPYFQSERVEQHRALVAQLLASRQAYYCYCSTELLASKREAAGGVAWQYDRTCCRLTPEEVTRLEAEGRPRAVRFRVPAGTTRFTDLVHGAITFDGANIEDFVILRSDGQPTYHLSVVSDDIGMQITHVIRGDDHISNTPKHLLLYQAAGAAVPQFAHVPLILGPDKKRLSKRHGATSVLSYAEQGYLPEAMTNFLTLLGWSPGFGDEELFTREELTRRFDLSGISGGNAVFSSDKLDWFNQQHMARLSPEELTYRLKPFFVAAGVWKDEFLGDRHAWLFAVLELLRPRCKRLDEFVPAGRFFFTEQVDFDAAAVQKHLRGPGVAGQLKAVDEAFSDLPSFDAALLEEALRAVAGAQGIKAATLIHAVRVAITGRTVSPGLFEVIVLLGRERTHTRIDTAVQEISKTSA